MTAKLTGIVTSYSVQEWYNISPMVFMQSCCHLANKYEILAVKQKHCWPKKPHFISPGGTPGTITTKMWHAVSGTDLRPCVKSSQIRSVVSKEMCPRQTDRMTKTHTSSYPSSPRENYSETTVLVLSLCHPVHLMDAEQHKAKATTASNIKPMDFVTSWQQNKHPALEGSSL